MQLYNYTMQFANRSPFSQHLVPRYSKSPAPKPLDIDQDNLRIKFSALNLLRLQRCNVWPPRFKESSVRAHQISVPPWKRAISATVD